MTLRFYNGEYRFVLVDTEVHRCTDVVRQMQWRRPSCLASVNFIALIYLGILCFSVVTPKVAAQGTPVAPSASGNITSDITEMFTVTTFSSTYQFSTDIGKNLSVTENETNLENCTSEIFQHVGVDVKKIFCKWRTDSLKHCHERREGEERSQCVKKFVKEDEDSRQYFERYEKVLQRYDCNPADSYSMWQCEDCRKAYKDWLCATQITYYEPNNQTLEPCEDFCIRTEARCPYFLPQKPYCGQRTFFCRGPRETARSMSKLKNYTQRCFTCNFTQEVSSIEEMGCQCQWIVQNSSSSSSGAVASSLHHMGSTYAVLHALNLYILVMWTMTPTVVAGT